MTHHHSAHVRDVLVLVGLFLLPVTSSAQTVRSFESLRSTVELEVPVEVRDRSGTVTHGLLVHVSDRELVVRDGSNDRHFGEETISEVSVRDGLKNGMAYGLLAGALSGCLAGAIDASESGELGCLGGAMVFGGIGIGIGAIVDRFTPGWTLVYRSASAQAAISPWARSSAAGLRVSLRW